MHKRAILRNEQKIIKIMKLISFDKFNKYENLRVMYS